MLFGGYFIGPSAMPVWLSWIRFASFIYYAFGAIMTNQFGYIPSSATQPSPLQVADVNSFGIGGSIGFLILIDIIYRSLAYIGLRLSKQRYYKAP
jgi:hypothetical protein